MKFKDFDKQLLSYKDKHLNQPIFLIASGPSLIKTPLYLIEDALLFGVNQNFRLNLNFQYYGVSDREVFPKYYQDILVQKTTLFLAARAAEMYINDPESYYVSGSQATILPLRKGKPIWEGWNNRNLVETVYWSYSVAIDIMFPVAYWMGCNPIILVGWDFDYSNPQQRHFFDPKYSGSVNHDIERNLKYMMMSLEAIKKITSREERTVINATAGGAIPHELIPRRLLRDLVKEHLIESSN